MSDNRLNLPCRDFLDFSWRRLSSSSILWSRSLSSASSLSALTIAVIIRNTSGSSFQNISLSVMVSPRNSVCSVCCCAAGTQLQADIESPHL